MTLIYYVKVIPAILINSPLFSQAQGNIMKKIGVIVLDIFDVSTFYFLLYLEKVKHWATLFQLLAEVLPVFGSSWNFLLYSITVGAISRWKMFRNVHFSKERIFVIFYFQKHFQDHLLQKNRWPDTVRSFWRKLDENRLNGVGDKSTCFCFLLFQVTDIPPG